MIAPLTVSTLGIYGASLILYTRGLVTSSRMVSRAGSLLLAGGLVSHYFALLERARAVESVPYQDLYGSLSLFSWLLAFTYLGVERFHRQRAVAPFVLPFIIVFFGLAAFLSPDRAPSPPPAHGPMFALHVTLNVLAYAGFALAFVMSAVFLAQNKNLRDRKVTTWIWQFPALEELERMSRTSVMAGVAALCIGVALGAMWSHRIRGSYLTGDPKEIISLLILTVYVAYLVLSKRTAWRGARASWLCVCSFLLVVFSFSVVNIYLSGYHRYL